MCHNTDVLASDTKTHNCSKGLRTLRSAVRTVSCQSRTQSTTFHLSPVKCVVTPDFSLLRLPVEGRTCSSDDAAQNKQERISYPGRRNSACRFFYFSKSSLFVLEDQKNFPDLDNSGMLRYVGTEGSALFFSMWLHCKKCWTIQDRGGHGSIGMLCCR